MASIIQIIITTLFIHCVQSLELRRSTSESEKSYLLEDSPLQQISISPDTVYYNIPAKQQYRFTYDVTSMDTGDIKSHYENRDGDSVQGFYSLMEPDGILREVHYTADGRHGFRAVIKRYRHGELID